MYLACIDEHGSQLPLDVALQRDPYAVRTLLFEALFACGRALPDWFEALRAERSVRASLATFSTPNEKPVTGLVLNQTLELRTPDPVRSTIIGSAFKLGGPVAALGACYATHDSRSAQSRETVTFLAGAHNTLVNLVKRSGGFYQSPSVGDWLNVIFDRLDVDCHALACIFYHLGAAGAPARLFERARQSSTVWGLDSELEVFTPLACDLVLQEERWDKALQQARRTRLVRVLSDTDTMQIDPGVATALRARLAEPMWATEVLRLLAHAFPTNATTGGETQLADSVALIPQLAEALAYLESSPGLLPPEEACRILLAHACLSSSYWGDETWKYRAVRHAGAILEAIDDTSHHKRALRQLVETRRGFLDYLYHTSTSLETSWEGQAPDNTHHVDSALLHARRCISANNPAAAMTYLDEALAAHQGTSSLERQHRQRLQLMRLRVLRLSGQFLRASDLLPAVEVSEDRCRPLRAAVLCELGQCNIAIQELQRALARVMTPATQFQLQLALANALIYKSMQEFRRGGIKPSVIIQDSRHLFQTLSGYPVRPTLFGRLDALTIRIGLSIGYHLEGAVQVALRSWDESIRLSRTFLPEGHTDFICAYSLSELKHRAGLAAQGDADHLYSQLLARRIGPIVHLLGGRMWCEILDRFCTDQGREALGPQWQNQPAVGVPACTSYPDQTR